MDELMFMDEKELRAECVRMRRALHGIRRETHTQSGGLCTRVTNLCDEGLFDESKRRLSWTTRVASVEDGSELRFATIFKRRYGWWLVHNLFAHVLIGLVPVRLFFAFHDWTSRRMRS